MKFVIILNSQLLITLCIIYSRYQKEILNIVTQKSFLFIFLEPQLHSINAVSFSSCVKQAWSVSLSLYSYVAVMNSIKVICSP